MKINFFEVETWEIAYLKNKLQGMVTDDQVALQGNSLTAASAEQCSDTEILSVFIYSRITKGIIAAMPRLKLIATRSTGFDHIDLGAARAHGVAVANVPTYGENTVAEHAFALLLALSRKVYPAVVRTKRFDFSSEGLRGFDLKGKTLGIIGLGHIGKNVARMAQGFAMHAVGFDPNVSAEAARAEGISAVSFEDLLRTSDIITLHCPYNAHTRHLLDAAAFAQTKEGVFIINTARGGLIDTHALVQALESNKVAGAGLDVLEDECEVKEERQLASRYWNDPKCDLKIMLANHLLANRDDVVITPHNAWNSREAIERILNTTVENIDAFLHGTPRNLVT